MNVNTAIQMLTGAVLPRLTFASALFGALSLVPLTGLAAESALTLYALNCMGCHQPPERRQVAVTPLRGQYADTERGRIFFIDLPPANAPALTPQEDARLLEEIHVWKRSCSVIIQDAPLVRYDGERHVK